VFVGRGGLLPLLQPIPKCSPTCHVQGRTSLSKYIGGKDKSPYTSFSTSPPNYWLLVWREEETQNALACFVAFVARLSAANIPYVARLSSASPQDETDDNNRQQTSHSLLPITTTTAATNTNTTTTMAMTMTTSGSANWQSYKDQVQSWVDNEQHCVTAQRISQTLEVSRQEGSQLLHELLQEQAKRNGFQITTCQQVKEGNATGGSS
jgi:hypothetical protein